MGTKRKTKRSAKAVRQSPAKDATRGRRAPRPSRLRKGGNGAPRETALITGASSGIGQELARVFAAHGFDVVLVARRRAPLTALARELTATHGCRATPIVCDLTEDDGPAKLYAGARRRGIHVDVLVNNAGVALFQRFVEDELEDERNLIRLNVLAVASLVRLFAEPMVARGHGRILNVASVAAFQPTPWLGVYGASKAFVLSLTEALSIELAGTGVTITALCPGFVDTPLVESAERELGKPGLIPRMFMLDPVEVAREGYEACMAGRTICINGLPYELAVYLERMQPRWVVRSIGALLGRRFRGD